MARHGNSTTTTGTIKRIVSGKGFGFVADESGNEFFFHMSAVKGDSFSDLVEGDQVTFTAGEGPKGPRAENVQKA